MKKLAIVINGSGGTGKDTLCNIAAKVYNTTNVSTITPIKEIAAKYGWNGDKSEKSRKFLADLKAAFTDFNDLPNSYAVSEYQRFLQDPSQELFFVHIREPLQIKRFLQSIEQTDDCRCVTLLIRSPRAKSKYGNASDDGVEDYPYDYIYENKYSLKQTRDEFLNFLSPLFEKIV